MKGYLLFFTIIIFFTGNFTIGCQQQNEAETTNTTSIRLVPQKEFTIQPEAAQHLGSVSQHIPASPEDDLLALTNSGGSFILLY